MPLVLHVDPAARCDLPLLVLLAHLLCGTRNQNTTPIRRFIAYTFFPVWMMTSSVEISTLFITTLSVKLEITFIFTIPYFPNFLYFLQKPHKALFLILFIILTMIIFYQFPWLLWVFKLVSFHLTLQYEGGAFNPY